MCHRLLARSTMGENWQKISNLAGLPSISIDLRKQGQSYTGSRELDDREFDSRPYKINSSVSVGSKYEQMALRKSPLRLSPPWYVALRARLNALGEMCEVTDAKSLWIHLDCSTMKYPKMARNLETHIALSNHKPTFSSKKRWIRRGRSKCHYPCR